MTKCEKEKCEKEKCENKEFCGKKHNKNVVGIVSGDNSVSTIVPPMINPLQIIPVNKNFFAPDPQNYVQFNTVNYVSRACLWIPELFAFRIQKCGTYNVGYHLIVGLIPTPNVAEIVYPDTYGSVISVHNSKNEPVTLLGVSFVSGQPLEFEANGSLGIVSPLQTFCTVNLNKGDLLRIWVKAVKNEPPAVTGVVAVLGALNFPVFGGGTETIRDTRFTIEKI